MASLSEAILQALSEGPATKDQLLLKITQPVTLHQWSTAVKELRASNQIKCTNRCTYRIREKVWSLYDHEMQGRQQPDMPQLQEAVAGRAPD